MTRAINPAEASPSPDDPSEFTCALNEQAVTEEEERQWLEEFEPTYDG